MASKQATGPGHDRIDQDNTAPGPLEMDGLPMPRRIWAICAISFGTALFVVDGAIANVALPTIARDLSVSNGAVTSVVTVYQLVMVMVLLQILVMVLLQQHCRLMQPSKN